MSQKINIYPILKEHYKTLSDAQGKQLPWDIIFFYVLPLVAGIILYNNYLINKSLLNILLTVYAIFIPLLINALFMLFGIIDRGSVNNKKNGVKIIKQLYANVSYVILISLFLILLLVITIILDSDIHTYYYSSFSWCFKIHQGDFKVFTFILLASLYSLVIHIFLTSLMIIKRINALLSQEMNNFEQ